MRCLCPIGSRKEERSAHQDEGQSRSLNIRVSTRMFLCLGQFKTNLGFSLSSSSVIAGIDSLKSNRDSFLLRFFP